MLVVFDLDETLFRGNTSFKFGRYLYYKGVLPFSSLTKLLFHYTLHKGGWISSHRLHGAAYHTLFHKQLRAAFDGYARDFLTLEGSTLAHPGMLQTLKDAQKRGDHVVLLSNSPDFLVEAIAEQLQIPYVQGTKYMIDHEGRFSSLGTILEGKAKKEQLEVLAEKLGISLNQAIAYTDSYRDISLLEAVGEPIAVRPDRKLKKACRMRNWKVME